MYAKLLCAEFSWDDVKVDKHRENYLGHSIKAPVGRWQKGMVLWSLNFLFWHYISNYRCRFLASMITSYLWAPFVVRYWAFKLIDNAFVLLNGVWYDPFSFSLPCFCLLFVVLVQAHRLLKLSHVSILASKLCKRFVNRTWSRGVFQLFLSSFSTGKDLHWYTRENNSKGSDDALKEEIKRIKEEEEQAMREALGLAPKRSSRPQGNRLDKHDFQELVKRSSTAEDMGAGHADAAWVHGLGFSRYITKCLIS